MIFLYYNVSEKSGIDRFVRHALERFHLPYEEEQAMHPDIKGVFDNASKRLTGARGIPDFISKAGKDWFIFENKKDCEHVLKFKNDTFDMTDADIVSNYALNGAVHYGKVLLETGDMDQCFVIGGGGTYISHKFYICHLDHTGITILDECYDLECLNPVKREALYAQVLVQRNKKYYYHTWKEVEINNEI